MVVNTAANKELCSYKACKLQEICWYYIVIRALHVYHTYQKVDLLAMVHGEFDTDSGKV